ncbi:hypothetical protein AF335_12420 [Streptomyces eurocidicus]|uniref:A-factor biosynthesis hotdog domain-containing protein n=1 Tax=Streptomyces eurocidicus TaxID=66423 RepID=A0A2N8NY01_STREU|nr:ScbA/BarX family gamma-butyrolactone biosynthesis protein [Streptomyces eurocidicus]MBB5119739.1 hypothetical protein [Streptomyces eurocidicus]MBF6050762.1 hypothetical protein [Streptomyces eurocidicus]PNE33636.1 hypothetical protein AF335_12420 [Streptomyces eurocidicus]
MHTATVDPAAVQEPAPAPVPAFERTVPRGMVHRWALSEVFLTDSVAGADARFTAAAQLPLSHGYFRDHPGPGRDFHDALLVLESCRQAVTYAAHAHEDVPLSTTFMVTSWSLDVPDPAALACGERPGELIAEGRVTDRQRRGGRLRRLVFAMDLRLDGKALGHLTMDVSCTPTDQYHALRRMQRGSAAPTAFTLPAGPAGEPAAPASVGRLDPGNVVLDAVRGTADGTLEAVLSPRTFRNRSMYDHPYDHVPAMVFSEAARQCAALLGSGGGADGGSGPGRVLRLDAEFAKFAELDEPVRLTAAREPAAAGPAAYRLTATQREDTVARLTITIG